MPTHECPAMGCDARVPQHQLACPRDWYRLPKWIRDEVLASYGTQAADPTRHRNAMAAALEWYKNNP